MGATHGSMRALRALNPTKRLKRNPSMAHSLFQTLLQIDCTAGTVLTTEGPPVVGLYFHEHGEVEVLKGGR